MSFQPVPFVKGQEKGFQAEGRAFEELVSRHLDPALNPFGFKMTPQNGFGLAQPDHKLVSYAAVYEMGPDEYARRFPRLDERFSGNVPCIDLWIHQDPRMGQLTVTIEGKDLIPLLREIGLDAIANELLMNASESATLQLTILARALDATLGHFDIDRTR